MKRTITAALALAALASGCGGSNAQGPFYNMLTLGISIQAQVNQTDHSNPATSVTCIRSGAQTAECNATFQDGQSLSVVATISHDGQTWVTSG